MTGQQIYTEVMYGQTMTMTGLLGEIEKSAVFSPCKAYRYKLARKWGDGYRFCNFLMVNPSTADELVNDPTVERCERRAIRMGFDGLAVTNLFALRSTDPAALYSANDPIGPENDAAIVSVARASEMVICAWGNYGALRGRSAAVIELLRECAPGKAHYLRMAKTGMPCHPLYLSYELQPQPWAA